MLRILKRFFDFCGAENKKKFYKALFLGVVFALLEAVKIPAILLLIDGAIKQNVTESLIVLCLGMLVASLAAASVVKYQITMLQCEAGYYTACGKRIEIAEHMRYLPMGISIRTVLDRSPILQRIQWNSWLMWLPEWL